MSMKHKTGKQWKKERVRKQLVALGRKLCPSCNDGKTRVMPLPDGVRVPFKMGGGEKTKTT